MQLGPWTLQGEKADDVAWPLYGVRDAVGREKFVNQSG